MASIYSLSSRGRESKEVGIELVLISLSLGFACSKRGGHEPNLSLLRPAADSLWATMWAPLTECLLVPSFLPCPEKRLTPQTLISPVWGRYMDGER